MADNQWLDVLHPQVLKRRTTPPEGWQPSSLISAFYVPEIAAVFNTRSPLLSVLLDQSSDPIADWRSDISAGSVASGRASFDARVAEGSAHRFDDDFIYLGEDLAVPRLWARLQGIEAVLDQLPREPWA